MFEDKPKPIILVPAVGKPGTLCLSNVKNFLQDFNYTPPDDNFDTSQKITITRRIGEEQVTFEVLSAGEAPLLRTS